MSRETKRPRITRPTENRDENRRSSTQNFNETVRVEKENLKDPTVSTRIALTGSKDMDLSVI